MVVDVCLIKEEHFLCLADLYVKMHSDINPGVVQAACVCELTRDLVKPGFMAVGLYEDGVLCGFLTGYPLSKHTFYFSGIYVVKRNKNVGKLLQKSFSNARDCGYTSWEANCMNDNIKSILFKEGAKVMYTRVRKEY